MLILTKLFFFAMRIFDRILQGYTSQEIFLYCQWYQYRCVLHCI